MEFVDGVSTMPVAHHYRDSGESVDVRRDTPEPWASAMVNANATNPQGGPSITRLAGMAELAVETVRQVVYGARTGSPGTIAAMAKALRLDVRLVSEWAGQARSVVGQYRPPPEADLLTHRQRKAVDELIRSIAVGKARDAQEVTQPVEGSGSTEGSREGRSGAPIGGTLSEDDRRKVVADVPEKHRAALPGDLAVSPETHEGESHSA